VRPGFWGRLQSSWPKISDRPRFTQGKGVRGIHQRIQLVLVHEPGQAGGQGITQKCRAKLPKFPKLRKFTPSPTVLLYTLEDNSGSLELRIGRSCQAKSKEVKPVVQAIPGAVSATDEPPMAEEGAAA
jgi:hypothetical protein